MRMMLMYIYFFKIKDIVAALGNIILAAHGEAESSSDDKSSNVSATAPSPTASTAPWQPKSESQAKVIVNVIL